MKYYTYIECKEYLKHFNIKSSYQFYILIKKGSFNKFVNKRPYDYYRRNKRNEWISWEDFLSFSVNERKNNKYLPFEEARNFVKNLKIKNLKEWQKWCKNNNTIELKIPTNPHVIYKNKGWVSFVDWIGAQNTYKNTQKIEYLNYEDCKKYIKSNFLEIKNRVIWMKLDKEKLPIFIPKRPDYIYKKTKDWINWESFLDSDISPKSKSKLFLNFDDAKNFVVELKFKDQYEFSNYLEKNNINFIPKRPDYVYRENWKGYIDFLGCKNNKESIGERLIKTYLDENNIKYETEKYFESCKNINRLPFDFYLPDYNLCIEYDGELHYKSHKFYGGKERLDKVRKNDKIKTEWCNKNFIKLLRISYLKKNSDFI